MKQKIIDSLLTPSWLSGLIAITAGLVITIGVILSFSFNNSQVQQQLVGLQNTNAPALTLPGQSPPGSDDNSLQNTWPLLGVWMVIGLIVYFFVESITRSLSRAAELKRELNYVHAQRDSIIKSTLYLIFIRLAATVAWLIFIEIFFKRVIPYSITAAHASASDLLSLSGLLAALLSFVIIVLSVHLQTVLLRLCAGRPRLFMGR